MIKKYLNSQSGTALIEALLAFTFAIVIITAIVIAVSTAVRSSTFTKNQNLATQYAQEGLDIAKNFKDSDYVAFRALTSNADYCAVSSTSTITAGSCAVDSVFDRKIYINHSGNDSGGSPRCDNTGTNASNRSSFVASIVTWSDSKCGTANEKCHTVQLDSCFNDLNKISDP